MEWRLVRLYQLIQTKIACLASALVSNRRRCTSSSSRLDQNDAATELSQHTHLHHGPRACRRCAVNHARKNAR